MLLSITSCGVMENIFLTLPPDPIPTDSQPHDKYFFEKILLPPLNAPFRKMNSSKGGKREKSFASLRCLCLCRFFLYCRKNTASASGKYRPDTFFVPRPLPRSVTALRTLPPRRVFPVVEIRLNSFSRPFHVYITFFKVIVNKKTFASTATLRSSMCHLPSF